jgi:hypothetical protein
MEKARLELHSTAPWLQPTAAIGDDVKKRSKAFLVVIALGMVSGPAQSRSLQITGTAGYLSESELSGAALKEFHPAAASFSVPVGSFWSCPVL